MKISNDRNRLNNYIERHGIAEHFSSFEPEFRLFHYEPGELIISPFYPGQYIHFIVEGDIILYNMPDEESTVRIQNVFHTVSVLGEIELIDNKFCPFFVEAASNVYTVSVSVEENRERLLNDPAFLRMICRSLSEKLNAAVFDTSSVPLKKRLLDYLRVANKKEPIINISDLAGTFHVSSRQMLRILKELCEDGVLEHPKKGQYVIR